MALPPSATYPRRLELLAPAKNLAVGQAALLAGADAIYIGGPSFGARAAAGNSIEDITALCSMAHLLGARVYLTVNTLLYDTELSAVEALLAQARVAGVDALIVQDLALLSMSTLQDMEIHASTQMNIDTLEKVEFCRQLHFSQVVLPREFSLEQIRSFCQAFPDTRFEVFVSGAMCVSVSGICYISEMMTGRSANRGACAQICRLPMTLYKKQGTELDPKVDTEIASGHLLSMKDNLRLNQLEDLVAAGASSFKIEGRLKDHDYVVNQVAAFRECLDKIIAQNPELYRRASLGMAYHDFTPNLFKTFNRGFTSSYLQGSNDALVDSRTPKSLGEELGQVVAVSTTGSPQRQQHFVLKRQQGKLAPQTRQQQQQPQRGANFSAAGGMVVTLRLRQGCTLSNGDSFTFFSPDGELTGFRVNRISVAPPAPNGHGGTKGYSAKNQGSAKSQNAKGKGTAKAPAENANSGTITCSRGEKVYLHLPKKVALLEAGMTLYRNVDTLFIKSINLPQALSRKVALTAQVEVTPTALTISFTDAWGRQGTAAVALPYRAKSATEAQGSNGDVAGSAGSGGVITTPLKAEVMRAKLLKLGNTLLSLENSDVTLSGKLDAALLPLSAFNALRREAIAQYETHATLSRVECRAQGLPYLDEDKSGEYSKLFTPPTAEELAQVVFPESYVDPRLITNERSRAFYQSMLATHAAEAKASTNHDVSTQVTTSAQDNAGKQSDTILDADYLPPPPALIRQAVMTCRNCLIKNHALCRKEGGSTTGFYLRIGKDNFPLITDCRRCLMYLLPEK